MIKPFKHIHDTMCYQHAANVMDGKTSVGNFERLGVERFMRDLERDDLYIDLDDCRKIINYSKLFIQWKGPEAGKPLNLRPDQHFYLQQLFGWRWKESGLRRIRRSFKEIARKTGKTTELALQGAYHCHIDNTQGPQFWVAATNRMQASICITDIAMIIENSPALRKHFKVSWRRPHANFISVHPTSGIIGAISRDTKRVDGLDVSMAGIDEWHEHETTAARDILSSAKGNRLEPIESIITTAGFNIGGPCYTVSRDVGIKILDGVIEDDEQLVMMFEMDDYEQWEDEELWNHCNPNIPYSTTALTELRSEFKKAKNEGGSTAVNFKTKNLNMWMNSPNTWIDHETIKANNHGITEGELIGKDCYTGLDLSAGKDLNAFSLFFPNVRPNIHVIKVLFWIPESKLLDAREADYVRWRESGHMRVFSGNVVEYSLIADDMIEEMKKYNVKSLGFDSKYFYSGPAEYLVKAGYQELMNAVPQGFTLSGACRQIETWTAKKEMDLMNNPVLAWNFSNVVLNIGQSGHIYPNRKESKNKIDGVAASVFAIHEYQRMASEPVKESGIEIWN